MKKLLDIILICVFLPSCSMSKFAYPPTMPDARVETYKTVGDVELRLWIFTPEGHSDKDSRTAVIFFFGGAWRHGSPAQFTKHCEYLAARGMVAMTADYRVRNRHGVKVNSCVADAKSAIRWIRTHASRLGIDPDRIVASGGSAGGHLAAATATLMVHDDEDDNFSISAKPNALVLFNPAVVIAPIPEQKEARWLKNYRRNGQLGAEPTTLSPYHHIIQGICPTIIFHGTNDAAVPYKTVELFCQKMLEQGNKCELFGYKGEKHGFFNFGRDGNVMFNDTVNKMDNFLVSLGYLKAVPEIEHYK
ncbi:alpha/beta hydrolase [Candidatus Latescibacterota bacterium]